MLLTVLMVPAIQLLAQSGDAQRERTDRDELLFHAENAIEAARLELRDPTAFAAAMTRERIRIEDESSTELPRVRTRDRVVPDTTALAPVLLLEVESWNEVNRNRTRDGNEPFVTLRTAVGQP